MIVKQPSTTDWQTFIMTHLHILTPTLIPTPTLTPTLTRYYHHRHRHMQPDNLMARTSGTALVIPDWSRHERTSRVASAPTLPLSASHSLMLACNNTRHVTRWRHTWPGDASRGTLIHINCPVSSKFRLHKFTQMLRSIEFQCFSAVFLKSFLWEILSWASQTGSQVPVVFPVIFTQRSHANHPLVDVACHCITTELTKEMSQRDLNL